MKSKPTFLVLLVILLSTSGIMGCSAAIPASTSTATNKAIVTITPIPSATITSTPEPSPTLTLLPTINLPTEVISSENIDRLRQIDTKELTGKPKDFYPRGMDFTPDGKMVAAVDETIVYIWNGFTGQLITSFDHSDYLWTVAISPNGKTVASGGDSSPIKIWDMKTGESTIKYFYPGPTWALAFSPDNTKLASGTLNRSIKIWNLINGKETDHIVDVPVESLAFSPDSRVLAIGKDYEIVLWDTITHRPLKTFVFDLRGGEGFSGIQGVLFSPDGKMIAAANADNIAMVWDVSSGRKLSTIIGQWTIIRESKGALAFSPDGKIIATGNDNGDVIFWDVAADKKLKTIGSQTCIPLDLIFWPSGNVIEIACLNGAIQLWGLP